MKKKIILMLLIAFSFILDNTYALNITTHNSIQTNCDGGIIEPLVIYGHDKYSLGSKINSNLEGLISSSSEVSVYINSNKVNIPNGWIQSSNYIPGAGVFYAAWNNQPTSLNILNLVPSDRNKPIAQVLYKITRMFIGSHNTYSFNGNYIYSKFIPEITPVQTTLGNLNKLFDTSTMEQDTQCQSIVPVWCGDGIVDPDYGETCDPNDLSDPKRGNCNTNTCHPNPPEPVVQPVSVNGVCGISDKIITSSIPTTNLCLVGNPTSVTGPGLWNWSCNGSNGGASASCSATLLPVVTNGSCGSANGLSLSVVPVNSLLNPTNLCSTGNPTIVTGSGPWSWSCNGNILGTTASCTASKTIIVTSTPVNGSCGSANGIPVISAPTTGLCTSGNVSAVPTGTGPWNWTCKGIDLGTDSPTCSASVQPVATPVNGSCGSANGIPVISAPTTGLCAAGNVSAVPTGTGPWNWTCKGIDLGTDSPTCSASVQSTPTPTNGSCGSANGSSVTAAPTTGLCNVGNVSAIPTGAGPWNWTCKGIDLGTDSPICSASVRSVPPTPTIKISNTSNPIPIDISTYKIIVGDGVGVFGNDDAISIYSSVNLDLSGATYTISNTGNLNAHQIINGGIRQRTFSQGTFLTGGLTEPLFDRSDLNVFTGRTLDLTGISEDTDNFYVSVKNSAGIEIAGGSINVRVAKPAVSNTSGGGSFVFKPAGYSLDSINVNQFIYGLSKGNFVVTSVNSGGLSPENQLGGIFTTSGSTTVDSVNESYKTQVKTFTGMLNNSLSTLSSFTIDTINDFNTKLSGFQGKSDVKEIIYGNLSITGSSDLKLKGIKTILIEEGDLIIDKDISYDSLDKDASWAFIVKNGDIRISKNVKKIAGVFLVLNGDKGIKSKDGSSANQIVVDGGLYGNNGDLINNRTYIRATNGYNSISTGVIVNYSSRALRNPPPLLSNYIKQFDVSRVAK